MSPTNTNANLLRGTLELLILRALSDEARHGYGVLEWIEAAVSPALIVEEGTLYPALHRLEAEGWIVSKWGVSGNNRKAKYYRLTRKGARRAAADAAAWHEYAAYVSRALGGAAPA